MLIFAVAESDVTKDGSLLLGNLPFENAKVFVCDFKNLSGILVQFDGLSVATLLEFFLGLAFSSVYLSCDLVELGLQFGFLDWIDGGLRSLWRRCLSCSSRLGLRFLGSLYTHFLGDAINRCIYSRADLLELGLLVSQVCLCLVKGLLGFLESFSLFIGFFHHLLLGFLKLSDLSGDIIGL